MQLAIANGAKVWGTPWSPPASMKTNGSTICDTGPGDASLSASSYSAYATYLANYVNSLSSLYGIHLYALSVQNEPDNCPAYDGAVWSAAILDTFIKTNLGPTLASAGMSSTLIMMPEGSHCASFAPLADATMGDPSAADYRKLSLARLHLATSRKSSPDEGNSAGLGDSAMKCVAPIWIVL